LGNRNFSPFSRGKFFGEAPFKTAPARGKTFAPPREDTVRVNGVNIHINPLTGVPSVGFALWDHLSPSPSSFVPQMPFSLTPAGEG